MGKCVSKNVEAEEKASKKGKSPSKSPLPKESPVEKDEEIKEEEVKPVENGMVEATPELKLEAEEKEPNGEVKSEKVEEVVPDDKKTEDSNVNVETIETEDGMIITKKSVSVKTTTVTKIVGGQIETSETTVNKKLVGCTEDELPDFIKERIASAEEKESDVEIREHIKVSSDCEVVADSDVVKSDEIKLENTEDNATVSH